MKPTTLIAMARRLIALVLMLAIPAAQAAESITFFHNDISGTPMLATDAGGNVIWKERYRPYGERTVKSPASADNPIAFAGRPFDPYTGLSYHGARYYDPQLGRFLGVDPVEVVPTNPHSFNRYAYANNNPYRFVDPDGRAAQAVVVPLAVIGVGLAVCPGCQKSLSNGLAAAGNFIEGGVAGARGMWNAVFNEGDEGEKSSDSSGGKSRNKPPQPLPEAEGRPHSIIEEPGKDGQYTTHNGDGTSKQYRGSGRDHGGIPRPNVKENGKNIAPDGREFIDKGRVRPAQSNEIPGG